MLLPLTGRERSARRVLTTFKLNHGHPTARRPVMCGIVGMIGRTPVADRLLDSRRRLEYRGYDSAGIASLEEGKLARPRAEGKLKNLQERLTQQALNGMIGIDHTRWATHCDRSECSSTRNGFSSRDP